MRIRRASLLALFLAVHDLPAQASPSPTPLGEAATGTLVARFAAAENWLQKVISLLSLNGWWHPAGVEMVLGALRDRDPRLRAFAVEALLRCDQELPPMLATPALLDELIAQLRDGNEHFRGRVLAALQRLAPDVGATDKNAWTRWWAAAEAGWQPAPWQAKEAPVAAGQHTVVAQRASELYQKGLDLMVCIDSTGSMQMTIDALGEALGEMVDMLGAISPKLRIGIVHYKDGGELGKQGAEVVQAFSKSVKGARQKLAKLRADGGGDVPEAVLGGLEVALDKGRKWEADANKLVLVIGDAPPHAGDKAALLELARAAAERPAQVGQARPTTGAVEPMEPFRICAMGVFVTLGPQVPRGPGFAEFEQGQQQMRRDFVELAEAGGGLFVDVTFHIDKVAVSSKDKREQAEQRDGVADGATRSIVEHILVLSFGERYAPELHDFVRLWFDYRGAGFCK